METKLFEKSKARLFMEKLVYHYVKDNYKMLVTIDPSIDKNFHKLILKDWDNLDWFLKHVATDCDFLENIKETTIVGDVIITIYKVGSRYIRETYNGDDTIPMTFEFVSLKKKRVVVYEYEVID